MKLLPLFSLPCIFSVLLCDCAQIFFMALRLRSLYPAAHRVTVPKVFKAMSVGQVMNSFLPARAGDFYKVATLAPKNASPDFSLFTVTGIIAADKLIDIVSFLLLILLTRSYRFSTPASQPSFINTVYGILVLALVLFLGWHFYLKNRWAELGQWLSQFLKGLKGLLKPKQVAVGTIFGGLVWLCEALAILILSHYQSTPLSLPQAIFILSVLNLALAIPIAIANIGPFEASLVFSMKLLGVPLEKAIAIATVHHGLQIIGYLICGGIGILISNRKTDNASR